MRQNSVIVSKMISKGRLLVIFLLLAVSVTSTGIQAVTDTCSWNQPLGGTFNDGSNWNTGSMPDEDDIAIFERGQNPATDVTFNDSVTNLQCIFRNDRVNVDFGDNTYTLTLNLSDSHALIVGDNNGDVAEVSMTHGVLDTYNMMIGLCEGSSGVLDLNDGMKVNITNGLCVGYDGQGSLMISDNGYVKAGFVNIGMNDSGMLSSTQVVGADSELEMAHSLNVGIDGQGDLAISDGATVRTTDGDGWITFGYNSGSVGQGTVSGADSLLDAEVAPIVVGDQGEGYLTVENEAHVHSGDLFIGVWENSYGEVQITGNNSQYIGDSSYGTVVGESGEGWLAIEDNGYAQMEALCVGQNDTAVGHVELYDGGSQLSVANNAMIGEAGWGEMKITNGASVIVNHDIIVSSQDGSYGQVQIIGDTDSYYLLSDSIQPSFLDPSVASLTSAGGILGEHENSDGWVALWGSDLETAQWTVGVDYVGGDLIVGREGYGNLCIGEYSEVLVRDRPMDPQDPDIKSSPWVFVGDYATGEGGVAIDGEQAKMTIQNSPMTVGHYGNGSLSIQNGGSLTMGNGELWVGKYNGSNGYVTVEGTNSRLEEYSDYDSVIGGEGWGELKVLDDGYAKIHNLMIGEEVGGVGNVIVAGGSVLEIGDYLTVGRYGEGSIDLNSTEYGSPGYMTLGGANLMDVNAGELHIGEYGTLKGNGTIMGDVINLAGIVEPGASVGMLTIAGNYVQDSDGVLYLDIAGDNPGEYDVLQVNGNVTLNGALGLWVTNGFLPQQGMTFDIIRFYGDIDPDSGWFSSAWLNFGLEAYPVEWQFDLELVQLGMDDYAIRLTSLNTVPEPATVFLLAVGGALAVRSRRRKS